VHHHLNVTQKEVYQALALLATAELPQQEEQQLQLKQRQQQSCSCSCIECACVIRFITEASASLN
jgi:hypothetical protein